MEVLVPFPEPWGAGDHLAPHHLAAAAAALPPLPPSQRHLQRQQQQQRAQLQLEPGSFAAAYAMGELLGRGTFGEVRSATERATGRPVAVKVLPRAAAGRDAADEATAREVGFCRLLQDCAGVARLHGVYGDDGSIYVVQELCAGGDLSALQAASGGRLDTREAAAAARAVLRFLAHAHARGVCYGDVKPGNFVLRSLYPSVAHMLDPSAPKGVISLAAVDFGCCQLVKPDECLPDVVSGW
jgi:serine/threonine protein kinase